MIELALLEIGIQQVLLQLIQHLLNGFYLLFSLDLSVNKIIIKVHNNKDVKFSAKTLLI